MRLPLAAALIGFAFAEAAITANAASNVGLPTWQGLLAALGAVAVVIASTGIPLLVLDVLLCSQGAQTLARGLHHALSAGRSLVLSVCLAGAVLASSVALVLLASRFWMLEMSQQFGVALALLVLLLVLLFGLLLAASVGHASGRRFSLGRPWQQDFDRALACLIPGGSVALALGHWVEPRYALAPLAASVALSLSVLAQPRRFGGLVQALLLVASFGLLFALERMPPPAGEVLVYRPPYASLLIGLAQRPFDQDGDGSASALLGGDCNDVNAAIHPAARDIPGNGVDENCNGSDAPRYVPPKPTRTKRPTKPVPHDIIVLLMDALRPDRLSLAGYERKTSPQLDAFARENTWFRNAYTTAPSTRFSMASLFTGRDVRRLRYTNTGGNGFRLEPGAPTLARRLGQAGYRTVGYTITYAYQHNVGTGQGFAQWGTAWPDAEWRTVGMKKAEITTQKVVEELASARSQPLFLFAHYDCTHTPYYKFLPHDFGSTPSDLYDSGIAHCDAQLGRIIAALKARPRWDRTAVFIVSDHGELFGEHGHRSHGNSLYEPDVRVVLLARVPGAPPRRVERPVQLHWVAPTVLELAGLTPDPSDDAASLLDTIDGTGTPPKQPMFLFTELRRGSSRFHASAVVDWPYKLIRNHRTGTIELFNVAKDPDEARSLREREPSVAARLTDLLEGYEAWATR